MSSSPNIPSSSHARSLLDNILLPISRWKVSEQTNARVLPLFSPISAEPVTKRRESMAPRSDPGAAAPAAPTNRPCGSCVSRQIDPRGARPHSAQRQVLAGPAPPAMLRWDAETTVRRARGCKVPRPLNRPITVPRCAGSAEDGAPPPLGADQRPFPHRCPTPSLAAHPSFPSQTPPTPRKKQSKKLSPPHREKN